MIQRDVRHLTKQDDLKQRVVSSLDKLRQALNDPMSFSKKLLNPARKIALSKLKPNTNSKEVANDLMDAAEHMVPVANHVARLRSIDSSTGHLSMIRRESQSEPPRRSDRLHADHWQNHDGSETRSAQNIVDWRPPGNRATQVPY